MKKMKSKIATALVLGAISFGVFSFTTTPINAQSTNSEVSVNESEVEPGCMTAFFRQVYFLLVPNRDYRIGGSDTFVNYPSNALD